MRKKRLQAWANVCRVKVSDSCLQTFSELKLGKKLKYIVYKLNDAKTEIIVDTTSESTDYDDFLNALPEADCRWGVYDFEFDQGEGKRNKIVFIAWSPDTASIKVWAMCAEKRLTGRARCCLHPPRTR